MEPQTERKATDLEQLEDSIYGLHERLKNMRSLGYKLTNALEMPPKDEEKKMTEDRGACNRIDSLSLEIGHMSGVATDIKEIIEGITNMVGTRQSQLPIK